MHDVWVHQAIIWCSVRGRIGVYDALDHALFCLLMETVEVRNLCQAAPADG